MEDPMITNKEIRIKALESGVLYWQIALELVITPESFSRTLRQELEGDKKERVIQAIETIADRNGGDTA